MPTKIAQLSGENLFLGLLKCQTVFFFFLSSQLPLPAQLFLCFVLLLL